MKNKAEMEIREIYNLSAKQDKNSNSFANTLQSNIGTMLSDPQNFIFELLQNADDASDEVNTVSFELCGEYLLFFHEGKHFSKQDVHKICDNAQTEYIDKISDIDKHGYKGIGWHINLHTWCLMSSILLQQKT